MGWIYSTVKFQPRDRNNTCFSRATIMFAIHPIWSSNVSWESFRSPARSEMKGWTVFNDNLLHPLGVSQHVSGKKSPLISYSTGHFVRVFGPYSSCDTQIWDYDPICFKRVSYISTGLFCLHLFTINFIKHQCCYGNSFYWHWKSWLNTHIQGTSLSVGPWNVFKCSHIFISNPLQNTKKNVGVVMRSQSIKRTTEETLSTQTPRYLTYWSKSAWSVLAVSSLRLVFGIFCWRTSMDFVLFELVIANANIVKKMMDVL